MHIKRFTGPSVKDALKRIKAEFGEDALILSTKKLSQGLHEVVAAIDHDLKDEAVIALDTPVASVGAPVRAAALGEVRADESGTGRGLEAVKNEIQELKELKDLCLRMLSESGNPVSGLYAKLSSELTANGIDKRLADRILLNSFKGVGKKEASDASFMRSRIKTRLLERVSVADPLSGKGVVAFVGPPGVGKTTTIAKLAAIHALRKKRRLALVSYDTYRIAAAEQLKLYGKLIGVPTEVAKDAKELASCLSMHRDKDVVLIDTAGRSVKNREHMGELAGISRISPHIRFNLVLGNDIRDESLYDCVKGYASMPVDALSFTKVDLSSVYGPILNTMLLARKPVSYLAAGQRVPEDIEAATKERLVNFFMQN